MSKDRLVKFGLHCPILVPPGFLPPRFFSPWEVARGLLFPQHVRVPHQAGQAWELLGNSVSPLQCLAGLLTLDIARGRLTREQADESVSRLINSSVTLSQKRVVSRDGWDELVPVDGPLVADWEALQDVNGTPPRTRTSSISTPKDSLPSTPRASDDSRAPKDGSPDRGSHGYDEENPTDSEGPTTDKTRRYPSPRTPEDRPVDTPEKLAQNELFKRISGIRQHPNPSAIPEERLLHGFATGPSSEVHAQMPDTIPSTPILIPSTTQHTQEVRSHIFLHSHSDTAPQRTNQSAFVSPGMSRPIGASSYNHMDVDDDEADQTIPDPMTPPGCGDEARRSRSPLPRNRAPTSHSPSDEGVQLVEVRTRNTNEVLEMHRTQPVQMIKLLMSFPDSAQMTKLSYKHIVLASHSRVEGLDDPAWLALEYQTGNNVGCHCHWVLERSRLLKAARNQFQNRCRVHGGPIGQDDTLAFMRFKRQMDVAYVLPCARVGSLDFVGESRSLRWVQEKIQERYGGQFHGDLPNLQVLCDCGLHFTQLRIDAELTPGKDTCFLAMTAAWNRTPALVPELQYKDLVIPKPVQIPAVEEAVPKEGYSRLQPRRSSRRRCRSLLNVRRQRKGKQARFCGRKQLPRTGLRLWPRTMPQGKCKWTTRTLVGGPRYPLSATGLLRGSLRLESLLIA